MFRIAICEDNKEELNRLQSHVNRWLSERLKIAGDIVVYDDANKLKYDIVSLKIELFILDIMMPGINGIELGRLIRQSDYDVPIIYVTSSREFAFDAYGIHAIRYIPKPFEKNELYSALDTGYLMFCNKSRHIVTVNTGKEIYNIVMEEIMYIENNLRCIIYTLKDGNTITVGRRSGSFEEAIGIIYKDSSFVQTHKSYFVNMRYIKNIKNETVVMDDGREIPIARRRLNDIKDLYVNFYLNKGDI